MRVLKRNKVERRTFEEEEFSDAWFKRLIESSISTVLFNRDREIEIEAECRDSNFPDNTYVDVHVNDSDVWHTYYLENAMEEDDPTWLVYFNDGDLESDSGKPLTRMPIDTRKAGKIIRDHVLSIADIDLRENKRHDEDLASDNARAWSNPELTKEIENKLSLGFISKPSLSDGGYSTWLQVIDPSTLPDYCNVIVRFKRGNDFGPYGPKAFRFRLDNAGEDRWIFTDLMKGVKYTTPLSLEEIKRRVLLKAVKDYLHIR
jgi:hypothetical protein